MYLQYFGLTAYPFSISPDAIVYYNEQYRDAYAHLHYSVQHPGGIIVLTGEVGTGKTTLIRSFLNQQDTQHIKTAYIFNPKQSVSDLLESICYEFGIKKRRNNSCKKSIDLLYEYLMAAHKRQQLAMIVIDEAQHLDFEALEYLRLVTNLEVGVNKLVNIILVGQEELLLKLQQSDLRQFNQRVVARFHMRSLNRKQLYGYIKHRLDIANAGYDIIPQSLDGIIYRHTKGIPRLINILCDRALVGAYAKNLHQVDKKVLNMAATELSIKSSALQSLRTGIEMPNDATDGNQGTFWNKMFLYALSLRSVIIFILLLAGCT